MTPEPAPARVSAPSTRRLALALRVAALALPAALALAPVAVAAPPSLWVPARRESVSIESEPAPLLVPGRGSPGDSLERSRPQRAREQYEHGRGLEAAGQHAAAIVAYRNAVRLDPTIKDARFRTGKLFLTVGQYGEAVTAFAGEVAQDPGNVEASRELGLALAQEGDVERSLAQLERLVRRDPRDGASWRALGFAYGLARRPADAERSLRRAIEVNAKDASAWRDLGVTLSAAGKSDAARDAYNRAATLAPHDPTALINLGNLETRLGRHEPALTAYREAVSRDSMSMLAARGEVSALISLKREAEAGAAMRRWLARKPDDSQARIEAVRLFDGLGRKDVALELARDGVRHAPKSGEARLAHALALRSSGHVPAALGELRRAESLLPRDDQRQGVRALIRDWRREAPDSLRGVFEADSVQHEGSAK